MSMTTLRQSEKRVQNALSSCTSKKEALWKSSSCSSLSASLPPSQKSLGPQAAPMTSTKKELSPLYAFTAYRGLSGLGVKPGTHLWDIVHKKEYLYSLHIHLSPVSPIAGEGGKQNTPYSLLH